MSMLVLLRRRVMPLSGLRGTVGAPEGGGRTPALQLGKDQWQSGAGHADCLVSPRRSGPCGWRPQPWMEACVWHVCEGLSLVPMFSCMAKRVNGRLC